MLATLSSFCNVVARSAAFKTVGWLMDLTATFDNIPG